MDPNASTPAPTPAPGTAEHDANLAATFETRDAAAGQPTPATEPKPERPADVPEKFWDAEKGAVKWDAIAALDKPADTAAKEPEKAPEGGDKSAPVQAFEAAQTEGAKALTDVGLDYAKYGESFKTNGKLTDADYAEMESKNIPRSVVDAHINSLQTHANAEVAAIQASVFGVVGGEAQYGELVTWAKANVPAADLASFDKVIDTGSVDAVKMAVQNLHGKMVAAQGEAPRLINGGGPAVLDAFESTAQVVEAMKDPRYARDPAYRNAIQAKIGRSNIM